MSTVSEHLQGQLVIPAKQSAGKLGTPAAANSLSGAPTAEDVLVGKDGFSFGDLIDVINPLQHIPGVSQVYRAATGDGIGAAAKIAGAALFGGPIGAGIAAASALIEVATGSDPVDAAIKIATGEGETSTPETASGATILTPAATVEEGVSIAQDVAEAAMDEHIAMPHEDEDEKKKAAEAAAASSNVFRLGIDTVPTTKSEVAAEELAKSVKADPSVGIALNPHVSDVALKALGGATLQHQIYRQVQTIDPLYTTALDMSS